MTPDPTEEVNRILCSQTAQVTQSITPSKATRVLVTAAAGVLFAAGAWLSIRLSRADVLFRQNTSASVKRAVELDPWNGRYRAWLAEILENEGADATAALAEAARLNPMDSRVWIRRALNAELGGDVAEAERLLLHAAQIDRLLEPRWTLMNFYFRVRNEPEFWKWSRAAFDMSYGDRSALFELCWRMSGDASQVDARAIPPLYSIRLQFLEFLTARGQMPQAAQVAERLIENAAVADSPVYVRCVEALLKGGHPWEAVRLWNALCRRRMLPHDEVNPDRPVTNGRFAAFPSGAGFDWRLHAGQGANAVMPADGGLKISLSGKQPDRATLLSQTVVVEPRDSYRIRIRYSTSGFAGRSGLRARFDGAATAEFTAGAEQEALLDVTTGGSAVTAIDIGYERPLGHVRGEGSLTLREVSLERVR